MAFKPLAKWTETEKREAVQREFSRKEVSSKTVTRPTEAHKPAKLPRQSK